MSESNPPTARPLRRATLLLVAGALGILAALLAGRDDGGADSTPIVLVAGVHAAPTLIAQAPPAAQVPDAPAKPESAPAERARGKPVDVEITVGEKGASIRQGTGRSGIVITDAKNDDFDNLVANAAPIAIVAVLSVFLTPLLVIALVIWYKMRRARMLNETMLKLAERGIVPPAEAINALASGSIPPVVAAAAANTASPAASASPTAPLYEQARSVRRRTAWSDLRKGVLLTAAGLALSAWSLLDDGSANSVGLILLFVGIGYCILWHFEDRKTASGPPPAPPGGP